MGEIYSLIYEYRKGDNSKFIDIVYKFDPLLDKLQRNSCYEDMKSDLILFLFNLIDKVPIGLDNFKQDKYIVSYIHKSLKNRYIYINKLNQSKYNNEVLSMDNVLNNRYEENFDDIIFNDMIKDLTIKERNVICKIYLNNLTEADIARESNISRQAVHKTHTRALGKLKDKYNRVH